LGLPNGNQERQPDEAVETATGSGKKQKKKNWVRKQGEQADERKAGWKASSRP